MPTRFLQVNVFCSGKWPHLHWLSMSSCRQTPEANQQQIAACRHRCATREPMDSIVLSWVCKLTNMIHWTNGLWLQVIFKSDMCWEWRDVYHDQWLKHKLMMEKELDLQRKQLSVIMQRSHTLGIIETKINGGIPEVSILNIWGLEKRSIWFIKEYIIIIFQ